MIIIYKHFCFQVYKNKMCTVYSEQDVTCEFWRNYNEVVSDQYFSYMKK